MGLQRDPGLGRDLRRRGLRPVRGPQPRQPGVRLRGRPGPQGSQDPAGSGHEQVAHLRHYHAAGEYQILTLFLGLSTQATEPLLGTLLCLSVYMPFGPSIWSVYRSVTLSVSHHIITQKRKNFTDFKFPQIMYFDGCHSKIVFKTLFLYKKGLKKGSKKIILNYQSV